MKHVLRKVLGPLAATLLLAAGLGAHAADDYPVRPIRMIVPGPPGGITDMLARALAAKLTEYLPQPIVVINNGGGGGMIGAGIVAKAPPDGYTILFANSGPLSANLSLYEKMPYDARKDFAPVSLFALMPNVMVVNAKVPATTVAELIKLVNAGHGSFSYASGGSGSSQHIAGALFVKRAKLDMTHVPYKGAAPAMADTVAGQIPVDFTSVLDAQPHVKAGTIRALAVTSLQRVPALPDVPTMDESGLPGFLVGPWLGVVVPAGTPQNVIRILNAGVLRAGGSPDVAKLITDAGGTVAVDTPAEFAEFLRKDVDHWAALIKESGAKAD